MAAGKEGADPEKLRGVATAVEGIATGPLVTVQGQFMDAMTGVDNCMLETDFALSCFLPDWDDLLVNYQRAVQSFGTDLRRVADNFDKAGNSGDVFAAPKGR